jgi:hypothetical protein
MAASVLSMDKGRTPDPHIRSQEVPTKIKWSPNIYTGPEGPKLEDIEVHKQTARSMELHVYLLAF